MMNPAEFANIAQCEKDLWWYRGMRSILFRMLDPYLRTRKITRALEAGCGTGYLSHILQTERRLPVIPMDFSPEGLRHARSMGVERLVQSDIRRLPFRTAVFDLVLSIDVLAHMPDGEEHNAAREVSRVLAPGGLIVIRASALDILRSRHAEYVLERQRFTRRRLMGLMAAAGIRALRCTYANSLLLPVALAKFRLWEPLTRMAPASGVEPVAPWLNTLLGIPLSVESAWIGAGRSLPIGQSLIYIGEKMP
jgi:SAM-dependent methyltransferase